MSDLKERLRKGWIVGMVSHHEALERIEALEAEVAALKSNSIPIAGNRPDLNPTATASLLEPTK